MRKDLDKQFDDSFAYRLLKIKVTTFVGLF